MLLNLLIILNFDVYRDYEWCDQEGEEEGRMEGKKISHEQHHVITKTT